MKPRGQMREKRPAKMPTKKPMDPRRAPGRRRRELRLRTRMLAVIGGRRSLRLDLTSRSAWAAWQRTWRSW